MTELSRQEIEIVVRQLKAQEDILVKQDNLTKIVKGHDEESRVQSQIGKQYAEQLETLTEVDEKHAELLKAQAGIGRQHTEKINIKDHLAKKFCARLRAVLDNFPLRQ